MTKNLYNVLELNKNATEDEIKRKFKILALKMHPDKNNGSLESCERFNEIYLAYEILSNKERRQKYDQLNGDDIINFNELTANLLKTIVSSNVVSDIFDVIMKNTDYVQNYDYYKGEIETRKNNKYNLEFVNKLFKSYFEKNNTHVSDISFFQPNIDIQKRDYLLTNSKETSDESDVCIQSDINIVGKIKTTLEELYNNPIKMIDVTRIVIDNNDTVAKKFKYQINLTNDMMTFKKQGDNYITDTGAIDAGDLILSIECSKHKYYERVSDFDILMTLPITLYEMFSGFSKTFVYLDNEQIELLSNSPFQEISSNRKITKQTTFDGEKIMITFEQLGLIGDDSVRGNLIICLLLVKKDDFHKLLKKYFN